MQWPNDQIAGRTILGAKLHLYQYAAGSCTDKRMNIHPLDKAWTEAKTVYSTKPSAMTSTGTSSVIMTNVGGEGCPGMHNGWIEGDVTSMVQAWADGAAGGGFANYGVQLNVPDANKADIAYERRFCSKDYDNTNPSCSLASHTAYMTMTYNGAPSVPTTPSLSPSRSFAGSPWTSTVTPEVSVAATDPEGSQLTYRVEAWNPGGALAAACTTEGAASGEVDGCDLSSGLVDGHAYALRAQAVDEWGLAGPWTAWSYFGVDTSVPSTPVVSCTGYGNGGWSAQVGAPTTTCTFTASGVAEFEWQVTVAGVTTSRPVLSASGGAATTGTITVPAQGNVEVRARAWSKADLVSEWGGYEFGVGSGALTQPTDGDRSTSTFPVSAVAPAGATAARVEWRYAPTTKGDIDNGWILATKVRRADSGAGWGGEVLPDLPQSQTPLLSWTPSQEPGISVPSMVQVRVVFVYAGDLPHGTAPRNVVLIPHAFGGSYPTQSVGSGSVALFTGEFQLSESDVSMPGYGGALTFGRTHLTLTGDQAGPAGVFGPGWTADFAGQGAGLAGWVVTDNTALDGTFLLTSPEGDTEVYAHEDGISGAQRLGTYVGVGETALAEDTVELTDGGSDGATKTLTLTEEDGTITVFQRTTSGIWVTAQTTEPETTSTTRFARGSDGLISWIFAPTPAGVTCSPTTQTPGCRALKFTYDTIAGGKRLTKVQYVAADPKPGTNGKPTQNDMGSIDVAGYGYDAQGRLTQAWEPNATGDTGTGRKTLYEYTTINSKTVVTAVTDPGLVGWRMDYDTNARLAHVKRAQDGAVGGGDATWTVAYDLQPTGDGLPAMGAETTQEWGQPAADAPVGATAVFEPDHPLTGAPAASDWPWATISYFTAAGRVTNTAVYGAGQWLIDSQRYDAHGNVVWSLSATGRQAALAEPDSVAAADKYATLTVYNADGTRVEETYSPMRPVVLNNGTSVVARSKVETVYDDEAEASLMPGRPADAPEDGYNLAVEQRIMITDQILPGASGNTWDTRKVRYRYDPVVAGDGDGWDLEAATRTLTQDGDGWATTLARYDTEGKIVETRTPGGTAINNDTTNDTYSTRTIYYTSDGSAADPDCRNKPEWAGSMCVTKTAGNPSTGYPIPATQVSGYNIRGATTRVEQTAADWTRTTITGHDYLGRVTSTSTALTGHDTISGTTVYDPITGAVTSLTGSGKTEEFTYDSWGRQRSGTDGAGNTSTDTYDTAGRVKTHHDGKGTYTYTYDGIDARGNAEHRGLVTAVDLGYAEGDTDRIRGAYDTAGALIGQDLPGGYRADWVRNLAGQTVSLAYTQHVDGQDVPVVGFSQTYDHLGRVATATGPTGTTRYRYDDRGRLVRAQQQTATSCATRVYTFAGDSNRTSVTRYGSAGDGGCQTITGVTTSYDYDQADRIIGGYSYDRLGRTTSVPLRDTSQAGVAGAGDASIEYTSTDMVAVIQQTVPDATGNSQTRRQTFSLDASGRVSTTTTSTGMAVTGQSRNHYDGSDDSPAWTETRTDPGAAWDGWTRYVTGLAGGLGLTVANTGVVELQLANPHGDIVATTTLGTTGLAGYHETDEYGQPDNPATAQPRYGWLGTHQRDTGTTVAGLTLMGARLYNPTTGRFLSIDPVPGANDNPYTYPADPINFADVGGRNPLAIAIAVGAGEAALIAATAVVVGIGALAAAYLVNLLLIQGIDFLSRLAAYPYLTQGVVKVAWTTYRWNKIYRGYEVFYKDKKVWRTWKFGITSQVGNSRPKEGVRACEANEGKGQCGYRYLIDGLLGYYAARSWEYGMIATYAVVHWGHCPPGQFLTCK